MEKKQNSRALLLFLVCLFPQGLLIENISAERNDLNVFEIRFTLEANAGRHIRIRTSGLHMSILAAALQQ